MRKWTVLVCALAFAACSGLPAIAQTTKTATAPESDAAGTPACIATLSLPAEITGQAPSMMTSCSAEKTDCFGGGSVSCNGVNTCEVVYNGVRCDGVLTACTCNAPPACTGGNGQAYCDCRNAGGSHFTCVCTWCIGCP